jgi:predicted Zn-dependent protease
MNAQQKRIETILNLLQNQPDDVFLNYALGLEYVSVAEHDSALKLFHKLTINNPDYVATYYQLAKVYEQLKDKTNAISAYKNGINVALKIKDVHALSELRSALNELEFED